MHVFCCFRAEDRRGVTLGPSWAWLSQFQILFALPFGTPAAGQGRVFSAESEALRSRCWVVLIHLKEHEAIRGVTSLGKNRFGRWGLIADGIRPSELRTAVAIGD
jgi:hypothetical protein